MALFHLSLQLERRCEACGRVVGRSDEVEERAVLVALFGAAANVCRTCNQVIGSYEVCEPAAAAGALPFDWIQQGG